jgi:D-3-phosphoglycerate dehydrogenase / 2-oxoglutarate reductase
MTRILTVDTLPPAALEGLARLGLEVDARPALPLPELQRALEGASILVVRSTKVPREAILGARELALIIRAGAGVNNIDVAAASERGIFVANCPGKNALAVAELALGLLIALDRRIPDNVNDFRSGTWRKGEYGKARGLFGRHIGIAGLGQIGMATAQRARALGMHVHGWSRSLTTERARAQGIEWTASLEELARRVDVLSLHLPLTSETKGVVGRSVLEALKPGALLINTSRAEVVDEAALIEAVTNRGLRCGLDVFAGEPAGSSGAVSSALQALPGVYCTHHIGASTDQAQESVADEVVRIVSTYLGGGIVPNCVNTARQSPARFHLIVRHLDRPGVLAHVLGALRSRTINVEDMRNEIFEGAAAACARIGLQEAPGDDVMAEIRAQPEVLTATLLGLV